MNWKEIAKNIIRGAKQTKFPKPRSPKPATPEPTYICKNCGMLIESLHKHTREECEIYDSDPTKPDLSLMMILKERKTRHGLNDPRIRLPTYYHSSNQTAKVVKE